MKRQTIPLLSAVPGTQHSISALHFGEPGRGPKAMIQAALHADEVPAILVAQKLRELLLTEEAAGRVQGEVVLVPFANPLGLNQVVLGQHQGRFDLRDGINFNRNVADLTDTVAAALEGKLGDDLVRNTQRVRQALRDAASALVAKDPVTDLKNQLLKLAVDSDIVLDMHCDSQASMHLYALTPQAEQAVELGCLLGAQAILLATESGDSPFDEACSRPWYQLQQRFAQHPLLLGCFSTTLELRGQADTNHALAQRDAQAIVEFLRRRGVLSGPVGTLPAALCQPTPLSGSEPVSAPRSGVVIFHVEAGERVRAGQAIADLVDADTGEVLTVRAASSGVLYARVATRWASHGQRLAKIAGTTLARTGKLLSP